MQSYDDFHQLRSQSTELFKHYPLVVLPSIETKQINPIMYIDVLNDSLSKAKINKTVSFKRIRLDNDSIVLKNTELQ